MQKIACVFSFQESSWVSCQKIVFNLHEAWSKNPELEIQNFNLSANISPSQNQQLALSVAEYSPDTIIILDHKPHPITFFESLVPLLSTSKRPKIIFHVFGDFTLHYKSWSSLGIVLKEFDVKFIVASERQKNLIDRFLTLPMTSEVCPFPVNASEFSYTENLREAQRAEWGLKDKDIALVFTGRLSRQKRIHTLLTLFSEYLIETKIENMHLYLYGNPDNIGDPFFAIWETEGEYFRKIYKIYENLPPTIQAKIHFMGAVPNKELKSIYHGADYLTNLSVHNDEDFGMSVAEAQACGLPAILTDWGGLSGFGRKEMPEATYFIPVKIGIKSKFFSPKAVKKALDEIVAKKNTVDRKKLSSIALSALGTNAAATILLNILHKPWQKFLPYSELFERVQNKNDFDPIPYLTSSRKVNKLFREIYSSYVRED